MAKIKILYAGTSPLLGMASRHFCQFHNHRGADLECEKLEISEPAELEAALQSAGPVQAVRLDPDLSVDLLARTAVQPLKVSQYGVADCLIWKNNKWDVSLFFEDALRNVIVHQGKNLDMREAAYVIGEGSLLRVVAGVALSLGFRRVALVGENEGDIEDQKIWLERLFLGASVTALPAHSLTVQTVGASLLINTLDLTDRPELSTDLSYFNFMKRQGLVMDLLALERKNPVLEEALRAELRIVPPHEVSGQTEILMADALGLPGTAVAGEFLNSWYEFMREHSEKNPPSV